MNWAYFLHADCDAIIFSKANIILYYLWLLNASLLQFYLDPVTS